jgi:hypothetical protein
MKKKEIKGIIHDLLELRGWKNPLENIFVDRKIEVNLLTGEIFGLEQDSLWKLYKEKSEWFKNRVGSAIKDFEEAKILAYGAEEKIKIVFREKTFEDSKIY